MRAATLGDAMQSAGLSRSDAEFGAAVIKFLKSGGTVVRGHELIDAAAKRMSGMGQVWIAGTAGRPVHAQTRQPVEDDGAKGTMPQGRSQIATPSSSNRGGEGRIEAALTRHPQVAIPVREPSKAQRFVAGLIAKASAVTVLDTLKIDGRAIGDWTVAEARAVGKTKTREGRILIEASRVVANAPANALLRDVIKATELQKIMQKAAEVSDAA